MKPIDIGAHPDAPDHYLSFGKPADWAEEDCGTLTVRRVGATGDLLHEPAARVVRSDLPSGEQVYPAYMSEWVFSPEEKLLIAAGKPLRILISGNSLPPLAAWVRGLDEA